MGLLGVILSGSFAGAGVGLCVGILGALAGSLAEKALDTTVISFEAGLYIVPLTCTVGGLLMGALGAFSGTWGRGLLIGVVVVGLLGGWWLAAAWDFPPSVKVWSVTVWETAGGAAGAVGGLVCQRLGKKDAPAKKKEDL
jgi:hypothetical protein